MDAKRGRSWTRFDTLSCNAALARLAELGRRPDLIVCDYRLSAGAIGTDAIEDLRNAFEIPALLVSGDGSSPPSDGGNGGYHLLHKPVDAATFRAALINASVLRASNRGDRSRA